MNALRRSVTSQFARRRFMATESQRPYAPPPPAPESRRAVWVRNFVIGAGCSVVAFIFLKPWDGDSILGHLDAPANRKPAMESPKKEQA